MNGSSRNRNAPARVFARSTWLAADPATVYAFHENPANLRRISPPSLRVERIECAETARVGERFRIVARQFGVPLDWTGEWLAVEAPGGPHEAGRLVDGAVRAPFARFDHEHIFTPERDGTRLTDRVTFSLLGRWTWIDRILGAVMLPAMFRARHRATEAFFATPPA